MQTKKKRETQKEFYRPVEKFKNAIAFDTVDIIG